jgi:hypothetical protein
MAEDGLQLGSAPPRNSASADSSGTGDTNVSQWIKNLAALVTIAVALGGIYVSVRQLRAKAEADALTAETARQSAKQVADTNLADENVKLQIATLQLKQHSDDIAADSLKHKLDLDTAAALDKEKQEQTSNADLATIITRMLSGTPQQSSEGDMALLFDHLSRDPSTREGIQNAVLARLEAPRSRAEIDIGIRLLEKSGLNSLDVLVQTNRSAKSRYDYDLLTRFEEALTLEGQKSGPPATRATLAAIAMNDVLPTVASDRCYATAVLQDAPTDVTTSVTTPIEQHNTTLSHDQELALAVMETSARSILKVLATPPIGSPVDVDGTYLSFKGMSTRDLPRVSLRGAYVGRDILGVGRATLPVPSYVEMLTTESSADGCHFNTPH